MNGLEPLVSEDCGLKLCLADKHKKMVGPQNHENAIEKVEEEIEGWYILQLCCLYFF